MLQPQQFRKNLLHWFDQHGRKNLPWQQHKTPYRVWVSEIMLQQTQVNTVIAYYARFMQTFPDIFSLANAKEDHVLHLWTGLGYYSRACNLHRTAKILVQNHKGHFPDTLAELQKLPGIGQSTAAAILSLAFNQKAAILDGNVKRVLARLHAIKTPINEKETENKLWELAQCYAAKHRAADYTQAMMDLGATLCVRNKPQCTRCSFMATCAAYQQDIVHLLPSKNPKPAIPIRKAGFLILKKADKILLCKRPEKGIWGGLFCLPEMAGEPNRESIQGFCQEKFQLQFKTYQLLKPFRHTFTHHHLDLFPVLIEVNRSKIFHLEGQQQIWYNPKQSELIGLPKPILSILQGLS